ncbi:LacI family transcriptional regulator [Ruminococcaceae bacterium OttesenSCG-928-A16]|nr:LacI family transcriptional regulator [Ruminococcaceae bacterium OttesenSCG-928-A16]
MPLTIYDIAKLAGVSITTVSRVMNGKEGVTEKTRAKIQAVLDESGYAPSQLARGLASKLSRTVGIVAVDIRDVHHAALVYQAERWLGMKGYSCIVYSLSGRTEDLGLYLDMMVSRQVDGIVFTGSVFAGEPCRTALLEKTGDIPCVLMNATLPAENFYGILSDEREAFTAAVDFLAQQKSRKNIALIYSGGTASEEEKRAGYRLGMQQNGLQKYCAEIQCPFSIKSGSAITQKVMQENPKTDAILYTTDLIAAGGIHALCDAGIAVPGQVAVVGTNNSDYARICRPTITSIDNKAYPTGKLAAETLVAAIEGNHPPKVQHIGCELIERGST